MSKFKVGDLVTVVRRTHPEWDDYVKTLDVWADRRAQGVVESVDEDPPIRYSVEDDAGDKWYFPEHVLELTPHGDTHGDTDRLEYLERENAYLEQLLCAIVTGNIPEGADLTTVVYAQRARGYLTYINSGLGCYDAVSVYKDADGNQ
jgi:hypothetical protein